MHDLATPALLVDLEVFDRNVATMATRWPGTRLRPHVKAFKSTALAARLAAAGHTAFCCATVREVVGMAGAGLGDDLLLANESVALERLTPVVESGAARITVAVDQRNSLNDCLDFQRKSTISSCNRSATARTGSEHTNSLLSRDMPRARSANQSVFSGAVPVSDVFR